MKKSVKVLERKKKEIYRRMPHTDKIIKGTIIESSHTCGKAGCKCERGETHAYMGISHCMDGKSVLTYIPKTIQKEVKEYVKNYKLMQKSINELSKINLRILKEQI